MANKTLTARRVVMEADVASALRFHRDGLTIRRLCDVMCPVGTEADTYYARSYRMAYRIVEDMIEKGDATWGDGERRRVVRLVDKRRKA